MKQIQLNLNRCKNISDIYQEIKTKLKLPQNCGENLDALWDSLRCYTDEPMIVEVFGIKELSNELREYTEGKL